ncbi:MAG: DUF5131 family protein [Vicinamibacterales bacterium]
MSATTSIEWTDKTWNPVRGCSVISPGCVNCYAMKLAHRFSGPGKPYEGLTKLTKAGPQWTGQIRLVEEALAEPLRWRKPARIFVNSMSDLFHEGVPDEFIASVFGVMAASPWHTFQVLTKRPARMRNWFRWIEESAVSKGGAANAARGVRWHLWHHIDDLRVHDPRQPWIWPLPNVWLGVSVENQQQADARIPLLLETPAAVRWISAEPLLERVELGPPTDDSFRLLWPFYYTGTFNAEAADHAPPCPERRRNLFPNVNWVVVGGESGPGARPFELAWARDLIAQCHATQTPVFVKQLGARPRTGQPNVVQDFSPFRDRKGGDLTEWPEDLRVREFPRFLVPA